MSDIEQLQGRIMAALERIGQGLDTLSPEDGDQPGGPDEVSELRQALEDERLANAQLEERVKQLNARTREAEEAARSNQQAEAEHRTRHAEALRRTDSDLQALRKANQQLRENNAALREANAAGVAEPHLINKAMMAEIEALRAARAADRAEVDLVLSELDDIVSDAGPAEGMLSAGPAMDGADGSPDTQHKEDV